MKRDIYAYLTSFVLILAIGFSVFLVISDNDIPFTTLARVKTSILNLSPQVSGNIEKVLVKEGETVSAGQTLFQLDPSQYQLAVNKARANLHQAQSQWQQTKLYLKRIATLNKSSLTSKEKLDEAIANEQSAAANVQAAQATLQIAQRNLDHTKVITAEPGIVTNLAYQVGMYVTPSSTLVHIINRKKFWLAADFTEKGLPVLTPNREVNIVFDAYPDHVFHGHISSIDPAILAGAESATSLAQVDSETRWIRPQQQIRVRIQVDHAPSPLVAGSRASVMVRDKDHISDIWMTMLSWMRYVY